MNHSDLYLMMTVTSRSRMPDFIQMYRDKGLETHFLSLGHGTASQGLMRMLALNETEKMVCMTVVTGRKWLEVKKAMTVRLRIEAPGVGIAYVMPLSAMFCVISTALVLQGVIISRRGPMKNPSSVLPSMSVASP